MAWFSGKKSSAEKDTEVLRDALVYLIYEWRGAGGARRNERLDRLAERVRRFPTPTGLVRELEQHGPGGSRGASTSLPAEASAAVKATAVAMRTAALVNRVLDRHIADFIVQIPRRLGAAEAKRVIKAANKLREAAATLRKRDEEARHEVSNLVRDLTKELQTANDAGERLDENLKKATTSLESDRRPDDVRRARRKLLALVRDLSEDTARLRKDLMLARTRTNALEEVVAEQEQEIVDLRAKAALDGLTGVCNRRTFDVYLPQAVSRSRRMHIPVSLAMFDLDDFKKVNEEQGRPLGDAILKAFARHLMAGVRNDDAVFRIGGEEFAVLLHGAEPDLATSTVDQLRRSFGECSFQTDDGESVSVRVSAGVAHFVKSESHRDFYARSDRALLAAKRAGKDRSVESTKS
jgi:diguanylate cyclase (GGDEF)-like protein